MIFTLTIVSSRRLNAKGKVANFLARMDHTDACATCPKGHGQHFVVQKVRKAPQSSIQTLSTPGRNFSGKADLLNPAIYFHHHFSNHKSADCRLRDRRSPQGTDERPALVRLLAESENDRRLAHRGSSETRLSDRRKQRPRSRQSRFQRGPQKPIRNRRSAAPR